MQVGFAIDPTPPFSYDELDELVRRAASLEYASAWSPSGPTRRDAFQVSRRWWEASRERVSRGLEVGIGVIVAPAWTVTTLAAQAATVGEMTGGRFVLGIGPGGPHLETFREAYQLPRTSTLGVMREYLQVLRALLAGDTVDHEGQLVSVRGVQLAFDAPRVPVYLAALGPRLLELGGELADGVMINWSTPEQIAWSRERVREGARRAGRDSASVPLVQYVRVCVDDDPEAARHALARHFLGYALARPGSPKTASYRGHFARMGFDDALTELEARRDRGASPDDLADTVPEALLGQVGYWGPASRAGAAFRRLSQGLDTALVRLVPVRPGLDNLLQALEACRPTP